MTIKYLDSKRISLLEADRTLVQGNSGGYGTPSSVSTRGAGGGGGGASSVGVSADGTTSGSNGGAGYNNSISGTSTGYAGGGAGAVDNTTGSGTASHGANNSGAYPSNNADANTGAGGSGGGNDTGTNYTGGAGGSGIVIIRFTTSGNGYSQAGGTVDTSVSGQTIISWTATSGTRTFTPTSAFNVEYLVIGGGGSGGNRQHGGGGGSGAYRTSTSHAVTAQAYTIVVGAGGASPVGSSNTNGNNGSDSSFDNITSIGGGYGGAFANLGGSGGSGGGGGATSASTLASGTSSDETPTNVQDNSILVEKDTGEIYWFDEDPTGTTTKTYDHYTSTGSQFDGLFTGNIIRGGIKIVSGSPAINTYIQKVKLSVKKLGSPSGNLTITVRDDSDTILASGTLANSSITTSYADYEITLDSAVKLAINYRVMGEYSGGDSSNNLIMEMQQTTIETGYENTKYNGSAYSSYGTGYRPSFTFDSTPASITTPATWTNPVCAGTISSTATMGSNGDFDVEYTTVASKTGSGQRGCNAWEFNGLSTSPYTGRNAVKGATNADFAVSSSTAFTIAAWVKLNTLGQQHTILGYSGAYTNTFWTNLGISASNKVEGHTANNGISNNYIPTGNSLSVDTWHHCVFIHEADKSVTVYLDADTANKGTGTGDTGSASSGFWTIAGRWGNAVTIPTFPFLDGFIDQATLWNVALSEADVTTLYNGGRLTPPSVSQNNIKGYWTFSETSGGAVNKAV